VIRVGGDMDYALAMKPGIITEPRLIDQEAVKSGAMAELT
jgi:hypothetical protein